MNKKFIIFFACLLLFMAVIVLLLPFRDLDGAASAAKSRPLFGAAGSDIGVFRLATERLEEGIVQISDFYGDPKEKRMILGALFPIGFLKSLPVLEESRRQFIANPSRLNLLRYKYNLIRTSIVYRRDIKKYLNALDELSEKAKNDVYRYIDASVSFETYLEGIRKLYGNARKLEQYAFLWPRVKYASATLWLPAMDNAMLTGAELEIINFMEDYFRHKDWEMVMPPIEVPTDCFGDAGAPDIFYLVKRGIGKGFVVRPVYYRPAYDDISELNAARSRHFRPLKERGFNHYWQSEVNYYMCPDLAYHGELLSVYKIWELLQNWNSQLDGEFPELEAAIGNFMNSDPLTRQVQLNLFGETRNALPSYPDSPNKKILEEISALEIEKTGHFEEAMERGVKFSSGLTTIIQRRQEPSDIRWVMVSNSAASLYFMPFNNSVWLERESPNFIDKVERSPNFVDYLQLKGLYSKERLFELMDVSVDLLRL